MKRGISRREFLKGAAAGAIGLTAFAAFPTLEAKAVTLDREASDWLGAAPVIGENEIIAEYEADVVVVGSGTAGIFAACAAVEEGAETILIEKFGEAFGGSGVRDTIAALNTKQQIENGENPDKFDVLNVLYAQSNGYGDTRLYRLWADHSGEAIDWYTDILAQKGVKFLHEIDSHKEEARYPYYNVGHSLQWEGREYDPTFTCWILKDYAQKLGLKMHYETAMVCLIKEKDQVSGLYAKVDGGYARYTARKGVIVCTGGYSLNREMLGELQPETLLLENNNHSFPGAQGDGIKACLWAGGVMDANHAAMIFDRGAVKPDVVGNKDGSMFWMGSQPFLKVDLQGERFTNESGCYDHILHDSLNLPGHTYCMVWDANYEKDIERFDTHGCSRMYPHANGTEPVMPMDYVAYMNSELQKEGYIVEARSIPELAKALNIPEDTFAATVEKYNTLYAQGEDTDFGKEAYRLSEMKASPFYGVRMSGGYLIGTLDGIKIDTNMNVIDSEGKPIQGLYCAGDCSGSYFATSYPNLLAGAAAGRTVTFGRIAGKNAAKQ